MPEYLSPGVYVEEISTVAVAVERPGSLERHILLIERDTYLPSVRTEDIVEDPPVEDVPVEDVPAN